MSRMDTNITAKKVADRIGAYLHHKLTLTKEGTRIIRGQSFIREIRVIRGSMISPESAR